ncbi:unnamed protein product [Rotaria socialis]|nr:unnamed protein product [Rotaria socialis]
MMHLGRVGYNVTISALHMYVYVLEMVRYKLVENVGVLDVNSDSRYLTTTSDLSLKNMPKNDGSVVDSGTLRIVLGDGRYDYQETDQYDFIHVGTVASDRPIENQTMMIYEKLSDGREGHEQATLGGTICNIDR